MVPVFASARRRGGRPYPIEWEGAAEHPDAAGGLVSLGREASFLLLVQKIEGPVEAVTVGITS
jgi:hypothetical protein